MRQELLFDAVRYAISKRRGVGSIRLPKGIENKGGEFMPSKQAVPVIYLMLLAIGTGLPEDHASWVTKIQYAIGTVVSGKVLVELLFFFEEWYSFLSIIIASAIAVYFLAHPFFLYYVMMATIYVTFIFYIAYKMSTDKTNPKTFSTAFKEFCDYVYNKYK